MRISNSNKTPNLKSFIEDFMGRCFHTFLNSKCTKCGLIYLEPPELQAHEALDTLRQKGLTKIFFKWLQGHVGIEGLDGKQPETLDYWVTWETAEDWLKVELILQAYSDGAFKHSPI